MFLLENMVMKCGNGTFLNTTKATCLKLLKLLSVMTRSGKQCTQGFNKLKINFPYSWNAM